jgi:hypothetical protein
MMIGSLAARTTREATVRHLECINVIDDVRARGIGLGAKPFIAREPVPVAWRAENVNHVVL